LKKFFYPLFLPSKTHKKGKKAGSLEPDVHLCSDYSIWGLVVLCFPGKDEGEKVLARANLLCMFISA